MFNDENLNDVVEKFKARFNDFIKTIEKAEEIRLSKLPVPPISQNIKDSKDFFIGRYQDIPQFVTKIINALNNSEIHKIMFDEDLTGLKIISDGHCFYNVLNNKDEQLFTVNFNGSVKEQFDKPESEYKFYLDFAYLDMENRDKSQIIKFYKNKCKDLYVQDMMLRNIHSLYLIKSYARKLNLFSAFKLNAHISNIKEINLEEIQNKKQLCIEVFFCQIEIPYFCIGETDVDEYMFKLLKNVFSEHLKIKTLEEFKSLFENADHINKYLKSLKINANKINYSNIFYGYSKNIADTNPVILIKEKYKGNELYFTIYPEINGTLKDLGKCNIYNSLNTSTSFTFNDFLKNKEEVLEYLYVMKY